MRTLAGKVALVTDASDGSGAAVARQLAAEGVHVAIGYRASPEHADILAHELEEHGIQATAMRLDDGTDGGVGRAALAVARWFGRIDLVFEGLSGAIYEIGGRPANDGAARADQDTQPDPGTLAFWPGVSWAETGSVGVQRSGMTRVRFVRPAVAKGQDLLPPATLSNARARAVRVEHSRLA